MTLSLPFLFSSSLTLVLILTHKLLSVISLFVGLRDDRCSTGKGEDVPELLETGEVGLSATGEVCLSATGGVDLSTTGGVS